MPIVTPRLGAEAETFLRANPDVQSFQIIWTDLCGVIRGKVLRRDEVVPAWNDGRFLPISALVLDITGQTNPCSRMEEAHKGLLSALHPHWRGGVTCRVREGGAIRLGDTVTVLVAPPDRPIIHLPG